MSNAKQIIYPDFPRNAGLNVTAAMRIVLYMISEDRQFSCKWQTVVRLTEAGYISYIDGRTCITPLGRELLATPRSPAVRRDSLSSRGTGRLSQKSLTQSAKPGLKKASRK